MYPAVLPIYFISAAVILLASLALIIQVSLPYNKTGRASVLCNFIVVFVEEPNEGTQPWEAANAVLL